MAIPCWKEIAESIRQEIDTGKFATGDMLPSEAELALAWNVCRVTAHRAMDELHRQGIVARRRRAGTFVADRLQPRTGHGAVFVNSRDELGQRYLAGIREGLPDEYDLLLCDIRNDPEREAHYLRRLKHVDGIIAIPTNNDRNAPLYHTLQRLKIQIVFVDCVPDNVPGDAVIAVYYGACREALAFLVSRGYTRIAMFTEERPGLNSLRERLAAYRHTLKAVGYEGCERWLRHMPFPMHNPQPVFDALFTLVHQPDPPTAFFSIHDYMLEPTLHACLSPETRSRQGSRSSVLRTARRSISMFLGRFIALFSRPMKWVNEPLFGSAPA